MDCVSILCNLLSAFYLSGGGNLDYSPDPKDGYATVGHIEPRYHVGAGFSFDVTDKVEFDIGYRYQAMFPIPGHAYDKLDWSHIGYIELRFRPFRRE